MDILASSPSQSIFMLLICPIIALFFISLHTSRIVILNLSFVPYLSYFVDSLIPFYIIAFSSCTFENIQPVTLRKKLYRKSCRKCFCRTGCTNFSPTKNPWRKICRKYIYISKKLYGKLQKHSVHVHFAEFCAKKFG